MKRPRTPTSRWRSGVIWRSGIGEPGADPLRRAAPHLTQQPAGGYRLPLAIEGLLLSVPWPPSARACHCRKFSGAWNTIALLPGCGRPGIAGAAHSVAAGGCRGGQARQPTVTTTGSTTPQEPGHQRVPATAHRCRHRLQRRHLKALSRRRIIAFVGPDGVGKSALVEECGLLPARASYFRFKKMFRGSLLYALLYRWRYPAPGPTAWRRFTKMNLMRSGSTAVLDRLAQLPSALKFAPPVWLSVE